MKGEQIFYPIHSEEEMKEDPEKRDIGLFFFRGNAGAKTALTNAGGLLSLGRFCGGKDGSVAWFLWNSLFWREGLPNTGGSDYAIHRTFSGDSNGIANLCLRRNK